MTTIATMEELQGLEIGTKVSVAVGRGSIRRRREYERVDNGWLIDSTVLGHHLFTGLVRAGQVEVVETPVEKQLAEVKQTLALVRSQLAQIVERIPE